MSNIYIQEPPTSGKVLLVTSVGDIDVELWAKETPKTCRNFIQLCMEGYYDNTIFHRLVPGFIVQGGDPTGTGEGGEPIYGKPFKDEFHSRLRFNRRGLLGMANAGPNDNASQFFFTLGDTAELNNKHTLFGKITGDTLFNMLKMADLETDNNERPIFPPKINKTKVLNNPFTDIEPRELANRTPLDERAEKKKKSQSKATKDFKLLSFGEEAEEDEEESVQMTSKMKGKSKSSHDLIDDPKLSSQPAVDEEQLAREAASRDESRAKAREENGDLKEKEKSDAEEKLPTKIEKLRQESDKLKKDLKRMRESKKEGKKEETDDTEEVKERPGSSAISEYKEDLAKYDHVKRNKQAKGSDRERETMLLLEKFKKKIEHTAEEAEGEMDDAMDKEDDDDDDDDDDDEKDLVGTAWMAHKFVSVVDRKNKVLDANVYDAERYDIFDPRNPMNKRKLEKSKETMNEKKPRR